MNLKSLLNASLDLIFVPECTACGVRLLPADSGDPLHPLLCELCAESVNPWGAPCCPRCGDVFEGEGPSHLCGDCLLHPPAFTRVASAALYGGALAQTISRYKYGPAPWMARPLGMLVARVSALTDPTLVIPVPLHPSKLVERGFNQAGLLAAQVATRWHIPIRYNVLERRVHSVPQAARGRRERLRAMKDVFALHPRTDLAGKRILLVDDVVTTGATVDAASRLLIHEGRAASVEVLCIARVVQG